ncbi:MAG TPA: citramalate synthase [Alphaproteobacteria bacterium]
MQSVTLFDTTLRDGAQSLGVAFTVEDKIRLASALADIGISMIEGGFPGVIKTDTDYFKNLPDIGNAQHIAFGKTNSIGISASNDPTLAGVINSSASGVCLVGKSSMNHVNNAIGSTFEANLQSLHDCMRVIKHKGKTALLDAEHFFDGYKEHPDKSVAFLKAAMEGGADWLVLCDTNGGTFHWEVEDIVEAIIKAGIPGEKLGIHTHNDSELGVATSLSAVRKGVHMVQGTINGLGERTGNANLISIIPALKRMGVDCGVSDEQLKGLKNLSNLLDDLLGRPYSVSAPYVGAAAFTHKAGIHASAVAKNPSLYEIMPPESVGNQRNIVMSDQAGMSNLKVLLEDMGIPFNKDDQQTKQLLTWVKDIQSEGWSFDQARASLELAVQRALLDVDPYFAVEIIEENSGFRPARLDPLSNRFKRYARMPESVVKLVVGNERIKAIDEGVGPVDAIDSALRQALLPHYPELGNVTLSDYRTRVLDSRSATAAGTTVHIESTAIIGDQKHTWVTVGVSKNNTEAATMALLDAYEWYLRKIGVTPQVPNMEMMQAILFNGQGPVTGTQPH